MTTTSLRILTVVGARPQFIKAAAVSRRLKDMRFSTLEESIVHTGQHYDEGMSQSFFRELEIPEPRWNLAVGSGGQGAQTGAMTSGIEKIIDDHKPDLVLVYGDTNSTLAGALAAAKAGVKLAHVEAGLRSFRRGMPEEVNRVVADRLSDVLFCPTDVAVKNLSKEGRDTGVHHVGDVMYDIYLHNLSHADTGVLLENGLDPKRYVLATVHRAENTDEADRLAYIFEELGTVARELPVVIPLHPRTQKLLGEIGFELNPGIRVVPPVPYRSMLGLLTNAAVVATDSGGLQKEAYFAAVPCITLRDETEWTETVQSGWNRLAPPVRPTAGSVSISAAIVGAMHERCEGTPPVVYGDGDASGAILDVLMKLA